MAKEFKRYLVTSALPYANGPVHIGHLAGVYIPSDIYTRYLRLRGRDVISVCGSDEHGVPITIKARKEGVTPQQIVDRYHNMIKKSFEGLGMSFDIYSRTSSATHAKTASEFFRKLYDEGKFIEQTSMQYYDEETQTFLADRYIVGTCPKCGNDRAYGDQCEKCGSTLSPDELIDPHSAVSGSVPVKRETKHWYLPLDQYEGFLREDHSLGYIPHWFFADWASNFDGGEPIREKEGNSAFQDLLFVMGLDAMAEMEQAFGIPMYGERFRKMADAIRGTIRPKYWDENKGLFADTYDRRNYSQHVNVLAVLLGAVSGNEAKAVMERTLSDTTLTQATIYFRYYLNQALQKAGLGDRLLDNLKVWDDQMALGLTTWAEQPEPSRSDCHAWGASPNIEFFRIVLGIDSDGPGFSKVRIAPSLGKLKEASGSIPHPQGDVAVRYHVGKRGELFAEISLPDAVEGTFVWKGETRPLRGGTQTINIK